MIAKRINEGCEYPTGYGFAYRDWMRNQAVCYPVGLNWLAGLGYEAWIRLKHGPRFSPDRYSLELCEAYQTGRIDGLHGYVDGFAAAIAPKVARAEADMAQANARALADFAAFYGVER